ncbi:MAG: acyl-CoA dehydrogenase family protein [Comamonadaceae bacterium]|nr:acyl-CoA dehydrogenase family protein [Comamonadaceae bacterium]
MAREVERVDSGYRSMMSVQSSLVMLPIYEFGTEAQRQKYLPKLATRRVDRLLRPDRAQPRLRPRRAWSRARAAVDGGYRAQRREDVDHATRPIADVFVVWAKDRRPAAIRGFILDKGMKGLTRADDRGQGRPARVDHRRDRDGRGVRARTRTRCPNVRRPEGPVRAA